jgi:serine/threonine protein kinase
VVGKAIDIWALGVTLYCLLFGRTPFNAPNEYELFNVIWNEPIRVPDTMGIERQSLQFDPLNRNLDGPVQRDSRELIDLLRKLLEKDPRKRIKLDDVKVRFLLFSISKILAFSPKNKQNIDNSFFFFFRSIPGCLTTSTILNIGFTKPLPWEVMRCM